MTCESTLTRETNETRLYRSIGFAYRRRMNSCSSGCSVPTIYHRYIIGYSSVHFLYRIPNIIEFQLLQHNYYLLRENYIGKNLK